MTSETRQAKLEAYMTGNGYDVDMPIAAIHMAVYGDTRNTNRAMQSRLAPYISRFNRRARDSGRDARIVPGAIKQTYRITRTPEPELPL